MKNLHTVLSIVLSKIPPKEILSNKIQYDNIRMEDFVQLAGYYVKNYTNDELENLFSYIRKEYVERADHFKGFQSTANAYGELEEESFNIFDAILIFAVRVLQEMDGEPVCQYEQMLRWRTTSHELDEEVFTTAFLAYRDFYQFDKKRVFSWRPVIRHNNVYLNRILEQGMADNHFHLKGSAPQFPLSWISMMNDVTKESFKKLLESYSERRLSVHYSTQMEEEHIYVSYLKAALIRCYLFSKLTQQEFIIQNRQNTEKKKDNVPEEAEGERERREKEEREKEEREERVDWFVEKILQSNDEILSCKKEIQSNIDYYKRYTGTKYDYAICNEYAHGDCEKKINEILSGERWFMYRMFQMIFKKSESDKKYANMFYAYLVIKGTIRSELVQTNANSGFDNFAKYQDRKEDFIEGTIYEKLYIRMALGGTIRSQNIKFLEARITPKYTAEENCNYIRKFDGWMKGDEDLRKKYFYVFHFIKEKDDKKYAASDIFSRHCEKRKNIKRQAIAIAEFREKYQNEAKRVRGIDACAKEIGCRPEVFAQAYRYLKNHIVYNTKEPEKAPQQLAATYHIGEDYEDVLSGLRAIDEAIYYLQLGYGSRLGHVLSLGEDVEQYYKIKKKNLISQQNYLDNLVWLYYRIKKFHITGYDDLLVFIEQEYNKYFRLIYGNHISDTSFDKTMEKAREYFAKKMLKDSKVVEGYDNSHFYFRISEYYAAWKLRGDNPENYKNGYYEEADEISEWNRYAVNKIYPDDYKIRYNPECAYLYYLYHYCSSAKEEGSKSIEIRFSKRMVMCIKEVQLKMQHWIIDTGIGIETNPSSNYLIGNFKRYDKHPIFKFYNLGLVVSPAELEACPQIPVCINTDDQGIFSTYLENEYALVALALEKCVDEYGNKKYNRAMIYQWIDNVRRMGLKLSFADNNQEY